MRALKAPWRRSADWVSLKPPLPPFVMGVRRAHVTTTYGLISLVFEDCVKGPDNEAMFGSSAIKT